MPIKIICPGCKRTVSVAEKYAGATKGCPGCGASFVVPPIATTASTAAAPVTVKDVVVTEQTAKRWKLIQLAGVLSTILGATLFFLLVGLTDPTSSSGGAGGVIAALMLGGGLLLYVVGRVMAWWYHG